MKALFSNCVDRIRFQIGETVLVYSLGSTTGRGFFDGIKAKVKKADYRKDLYTVEFSSDISNFHDGLKNYEVYGKCLRSVDSDPDLYQFEAGDRVLVYAKQHFNDKVVDYYGVEATVKQSSAIYLYDDYMKGCSVILTLPGLEHSLEVYFEQVVPISMKYPKFSLDVAKFYDKRTQKAPKKQSNSILEELNRLERLSSQIKDLIKTNENHSDPSRFSEFNDYLAIIEQEISDCRSIMHNKLKKN